MELKIEYIPIDQLTPYENNTRKHKDYDVDQIAKSIEKFGFNDAIGIWSKNNIIVEGHGRVMAAKKLGMESVPCVRLDHLSDEERREYAIMHNKSAELSVWDFEMLEKEFADLDMSDWDIDWGFKVEEDVEIIEDEIPEAPEQPKSKLGDIYKLGDHYLMCGDSTNEDDVKALMNGVEADLLLTDPPYNVDYEGKAGKIENDNMLDEEFRQFLRDAFQNADSVMKAGAAFYIWHADSEGYNFRGACHDIGWNVRQCLIWNKNSLVMGRQDYQWKHEPCLYGWKEGAAHKWYSGRAETTVMDFDKPKHNDLHPTMKPLDLFGYLMKNSTRGTQVVLDLFGGSGTTLIVAEQLGRVCYMMEYDPKFVDVIIERWENLTGKKAELCGEH